MKKRTTLLLSVWACMARVMALPLALDASNTVPANPWVPNAYVPFTGSITRVPIGSSPNLFTAIVSESNCLTANQATNSLIFTRRRNAGNTGNSGYVQFSASLNGGQTWDTIRSLISDDQHLCRYPSAAILNPSGNTNPNQVYVVGSGPWHPGVSWQGNFFSSRRMDGQFRDSLIQDNLTGAGGIPQDLTRIAVQATDNGKVIVSGAQYVDINATTVAAQNYRAGVLNIGTYNAVTHHIDWLNQRFYPTVTTDPTSGTRNVATTMQTAWSQNGTTGYVVFWGNDSLHPEYGWTALVYKTTNGGQNWTYMPADFRNVSAITQYIPSNWQGTKSPFFSAGQGWDCAVDFNGNLHIAGRFMGGYTSNPDSAGFTWNGQKSVLFDAFTSGNSWNGIVLDTLQTDSVSAANSYWTSTTAANDTWNARLQISRTTDGKRLFFSWIDTETNIWGGTENLFPDLIVKGFNVETGRTTSSFNMTTNNPVLSGRVFWQYASPIALKSDTIYRIPVTTTDSRSRVFSIDDGQPVQHTYLNGVQIRESQFNIQSVAVNVTVSAGPDATICAGGNTQLAATGNGTTYSWSPTTGLSNPNIANPIASPTQTTTYTVTAVTNGVSATDQVVVTVNPVPNANAGADVAFCAGGSVNLQATSSLTGSNFQWSPTTGLSNALASNPTASPAATTTYTVTVSKNGCTSTDQVVVSVTPLPAVNAGNDVGLCPGSSVGLAATGAGTFSWSPATGLSNAGVSNPVASPSVTTTYTVTLTSSGCSASDQLVVTVAPITANAGLDVTICPGGTAVLNATTSAGQATYSWSPSTGLSATNVANPTAFPTSNTTYVVTVTSGSCVATDTLVVTVGTVLANAGLDATLCPGQTAQLLATGGASYSWSPATGLSNPNIANPIASPSVTTQYSVIVSAGSCSSTDVVVVNVDLITVNAGPDQTVCSGTAVQLNGSVSGANGFVWTSTGGFINAQVLNPTVGSISTASYTLTANNANCTISDVVIIFTNNPPPTPTINFVGVDLLASAAFGYQWFINGNAIAGANNQTYYPTSNGNYTVTVTDQNGCTSTSLPYAFLNTGLAALGMPASFELMPNPTTGGFTVLLESSVAGSFELELINLLGERLAHISRSNFSGRLVQPFDLSAQPAGVYFVNLRSSQGNITRKVVKQ